MHIKKFDRRSGFMRTRVVRQYEALAGYIALVTPTVSGFKLKRDSKHSFSQVLSTDNSIIFGHP